MCIAPPTRSVQTRRSSTIRASPTKSPIPPPMNHVDFEQPRREFLFDLPESARTWVTNTLLRNKDERNLPIFLVGFNIMTTSVPTVLLMFYLEHKQVLSNAVLFALGSVYCITHLKTWGRSFMLALHYLTHCSIYNRSFRFLDHSFTTFFGCFFGIPPGLYYPHHIGMHHSQDNIAPFDMSSTMDYNRASKWNHFKYMLRFAAAGSFELPFRLCQLGKHGLAAQAVSGMCFFYSTMWLLLPHYPVATMTTLVLPWVIVSFGLMQGNFQEHIFVDPDDHDNNYKSAMTCINAPSNSLTFNTGYHIEHHEEPGLPWYKLPELFLKNIDKHARNDSLVFSGIGPMEVGTLVLNGKFDALAEFYLNVGQPKRTKAKLVQEFQRRLTPIYPSRIAGPGGK